MNRGHAVPSGRFSFVWPRVRHYNQGRCLIWPFLDGDLFVRTTNLLSFCAALLSILIAGATPVVARINVNLQVEYYDENGEMLDPFMAGIERWDVATGKRILRYDVETEYGSAPETVDAITVGPDGYLYALGNNMGHMSVIKLNTITGATTSIFATFYDGGDIRFDRHGDLFAVHWDYLELAPWGLRELGDAGVIHRFDGSTGSSIDKFVLPQDQYIGQFDFDRDKSALYALVFNSSSHQTRVVRYSYTADPNTFVPTSEFAVDTVHPTVVYHDIWCGPDGLIYLRNHYGGIDRYTASGDYVDRFISEHAYDLTWIEGKLLALTTGSRIVEIDQITGAFIRTLIDGSAYTGSERPYFYGMAAFSVVPEPSAVCLLMCCLSAIAVRPLSRKRR